MTLKHQYKDNGWHRIVKLDIVGFLEGAGDWAGYHHVATYTKDKVVYLAVTNYYDGTQLEPNVIYQLNKTDFKSET